MQCFKTCFQKIRQQPLTAMLFLLLIAARATGFWFNRMAWDEEQFYLGAITVFNACSNLVSGTFDPDAYVSFVSIYGPAGKWIAVPALGADRLFRLLTGIALYHQPLMFIRFFTALVPSLISVWILFKMSFHLGLSYAARQALIFLCAFAFAWTETAHYAVPDSLLTMACVWALHEVIRLIKGETQRLWPLALAIAIAISSKINTGAVIALSAMLSLALYPSASIKSIMSRLLKLSAYTLLFTLIIAWPYLVYYNAFVKEVRFHLFDFPFVIDGGWAVYFHFTPAFGMGLLMLMPALLGILIAFPLRKNERRQWIPLYIFSLLMYVNLSLSPGAFIRWAIPLIPVLLLFAITAIESAVQLLVKQPKYQALMILTVTVIISVHGIKHVFLYDAGLMVKPAPCDQLGRFVQENDGAQPMFVDYNVNLSKLEVFMMNPYPYAIITSNWWNDLSKNHLADRFENQKNNASFIGPASQSIRIYVSNCWPLEVKYKNPFYTSWTQNPAYSAGHEIYRNPGYEVCYQHLMSFRKWKQGWVK